MLYLSGFELYSRWVPLIAIHLRAIHAEFAPEIVVIFAEINELKLSFCGITKSVVLTKSKINCLGYKSLKYFREKRTVKSRTCSRPRPKNQKVPSIGKKRHKNVFRCAVQVSIFIYASKILSSIFRQKKSKRTWQWT